MNFPLYFQNVILPAYGYFLANKNSKKAKHRHILECLAFLDFLNYKTQWK